MGMSFSGKAVDDSTISLNLGTVKRKIQYIALITIWDRSYMRVLVDLNFFSSTTYLTIP